MLFRHHLGSVHQRLSKSTFDQYAPTSLSLEISSVAALALRKSAVHLLHSVPSGNAAGTVKC
jgi:hypothetical protein